MANSMDNHARLSRAGSGQDLEWRTGVSDGLHLAIIQSGEERPAGMFARMFSSGRTGLRGAIPSGNDPSGDRRSAI
jgi:hypothetical protein